MAHPDSAPQVSFQAWGVPARTHPRRRVEDTPPPRDHKGHKKLDPKKIRATVGSNALRGVNDLKIKPDTPPPFALALFEVAHHLPREGPHEQLHARR